MLPNSSYEARVPQIPKPDKGVAGQCPWSSVTCEPSSRYQPADPDRPRARETALSIPQHQGDANQKRREIPAHTCHSGSNQGQETPGGEAAEPGNVLPAGGHAGRRSCCGEVGTGLEKLETGPTRGPLPGVLRPATL